MTTRIPASIHTSDVLTVSSENTGEEYRISVSLPASYDHKPETTFPVVYVTDANILFEMVTGITRAMGDMVSEPIVVGIGYPLEGFFGDDRVRFVLRRGKDFTCAVDDEYESFVAQSWGVERSEPVTGGAEPFHRFITQEVIPLIEGRYRARSTDRALVGVSTGGHFVLYAMLHQPAYFRGYVVGSPSLGVGDKALFEMERQYARDHDELPVRLFLGIGGEEEHSPYSEHAWIGSLVAVSDTIRFGAILKDRGYGGLRLRERVFEGFDHADVMGPVVAAGLRHVFAVE